MIKSVNIYLYSISYAIWDSMPLLLNKYEYLFGLGCEIVNMAIIDCQN